MADDLKHVRTWAHILSKSEIAFDMVSAVDELNAQVGLEFDFVREAAIQNAVAGHLATLKRSVTVPRAVRGLVTPRLLTMGFVEGDQIGKLEVSFFCFFCFVLRGRRGGLWERAPDPSPLATARAGPVRRRGRRCRRCCCCFGPGVSMVAPL
jgi:hypothetical protein